jgi:hypothetical protein
MSTVKNWPTLKTELSEANELPNDFLVMNIYMWGDSENRLYAIFVLFLTWPLLNFTFD